jgi:steroid 5-alpha reductase family enzyme
MLLETLLFALGFNILMFIPAFLFKTDKLTDMSYSLTFIALISYIFISKADVSGSWILFLMILLWALRLGIFLFVRIHKQKKDDRFDTMRNSFFKFLGFWLLQGITVWIVLIPAILFDGKYYLVGIVIWFIGVLIESIADIQKFMFKNKSKNKEKFIQSGLWYYSRHPNYFGEILTWIGVYIFSGIWLWGLVSPIYISLLLLFVSGIPILEQKADKKWGKSKEYRSYKKKTSLLIPWFKN